MLLLLFLSTTAGCSADVVTAVRLDRRIVGVEAVVVVVVVMVEVVAASDRSEAGSFLEAGVACCRCSLAMWMRSLALLVIDRQVG